MLMRYTYIKDIWSSIVPSDGDSNLRSVWEDDPQFNLGSALVIFLSLLQKRNIKVKNKASFSDVIGL